MRVDQRIRRGAAVGICAVLALTAVTPIPAQTPQIPRQELNSTARAYYYYSLAQRFRYRRDYGEALSHLKNAVVFDPESSTLRLELARLYWLLRNKGNDFEDRAREQAEAASNLAPDDLEVHRFLADLYGARALREGRGGNALNQAIEHHEEALALAPEEDRKDERLELGKLYQRAARFEDSVDVLKDLVQIDPNSVEGLYWLAMAFSGQGKLTAAVHSLERATRLQPQSIHLREGLADLHEQRRDWDGAIEAAQTLVAQAPEGLAHYVRLARLYRRSGRIEAALEVYEKADRAARSRGDDFAAPAYADLQLSRSQAMLEAGKPREALRVAARGEQLFPEDPRFPLAVGQLQYRTGDRSGGTAKLEKVLLAHLPGNERIQQAVSRSFFALGAHEERAGNYRRSERLLQRSIDINPENDAALNYLGYMWADRGEHLDKGVLYIERALRIGGDNGAYLDSLGWAYYRQKKYELAMVNLVRAAQMSTEEPEIHGHLGDLYEAMGRLEDAVQSWQRALQVGAPDPDEIRDKIDGAQREIESSR